MTGNRAARAAWLCSLCFLSSGQVIAEPLTSGSGSLPAAIPSAEPEAQPRRPGADDGPVPAAPGGVDKSGLVNDVPNTSKTVELLLEIQGKNPGLAGGERPKAEMPTPRSPTAAPAAAKPALGEDAAASPFGGAEALRAKPPGGDPQAVDWSEAPPSRFGGGSLPTGNAAPRDPSRPGTPTAGAADEDDVRWLIPRRLVRFVRENRDMVILGSIGLLLLVWAASAFTSGRRK
jgi:hypothetical protein